MLHETCDIVLLVTCDVVLKEGGSPFPLKQDRNPWLVGQPHKYFNFFNTIKSYLM